MTQVVGSRPPTWGTSAGFQGHCRHLWSKSANIGLFSLSLLPSFDLSFSLLFLK